jgi:hypothetical protein
MTAASATATTAVFAVVVAAWAVTACGGASGGPGAPPVNAYENRPDPPSREAPTRSDMSGSARDPGKSQKSK